MPPLQLYLIWGGVFIVALGVTFAFLRWLGRYLQQNEAFQNPGVPKVVLLGRYSPLLTWLTRGHLARGDSRQAVQPEPSPAAPVPAPSLPRWSEIAWLGLALLLAGTGQTLLLQQSVVIGLGSYALAGVIFARSVLRLDPAAPEPRFQATVTVGRWPYLALTGLVLVLFAARSVNLPGTQPWQYRLVLVAWLLGLAAFCFAVLYASRWTFPPIDLIVQGIRHHWLEIAGVALIGLMALAFRVYDLELHPYSFANDEGWVGVEGLRLLRGVYPDYFTVGWSSQPMLSYAPTALSVWLFGNTAFAVRLVSAVEGTLTVIFLYLLTREAFGRTPAFLAAGLLAALPVHVHFSRTGFNNIMPGFYAALVVWLVFRALRTGRVSSYLWAGLAAGHSLYTYLGARLTLAVGIGILGYVVLRQRSYLRAHYQHLLVFGAAAALVMAPQAAFFARNPDHFMGRLNAEGIFFSGWLEHEMASRRTSGVMVLWDQLQKASLVFVSTDAPSGFYQSPDPYLTWLTAVFFVLGMAYCLARSREPLYLALTAWFWAVVVFGGVLTATVPASQRLVMSFPPTALFIAFGLWLTARGFEKAGLFPRWWGVVLCLAIVAATDVQWARFYFDDYRRHNYYGDASNEMNYESITQVRRLGPGYRYYLLGRDRVYLGFANFPYLLADYEKFELTTTVADMLTGFSRDTGALFVAIPERVAELAEVREAVPGGIWKAVPRRTREDEILYYYYQLPPERASVPAY